MFSRATLLASVHILAWPTRILAYAPTHARCEASAHTSAYVSAYWHMPAHMLAAING